MAIKMGTDGGQEMLDRLHTYANEALRELAASPHREETWKRIAKNAQRLLDAMPKAVGFESVLTVYLFLASLDEANNVGVRPKVVEFSRN